MWYYHLSLPAISCPSSGERWRNVSWETAQYENTRGNADRYTVSIGSYTTSLHKIHDAFQLHFESIQLVTAQFISSFPLSINRQYNLLRGGLYSPLISSLLQNFQFRISSEYIHRVLLVLSRLPQTRTVHANNNAVYDGQNGQHQNHQILRRHWYCNPWHSDSAFLIDIGSFLSCCRAHDPSTAWTGPHSNLLVNRACPRVPAWCTSSIRLTTRGKISWRLGIAQHRHKGHANG